MTFIMREYRDRLTSYREFAKFIGAVCASEWLTAALESESLKFQARALELASAAYIGYCNALRLVHAVEALSAPAWYQILRVCNGLSDVALEVNFVET
jgi:hypothetical protein